MPAGKWGNSLGLSTLSVIVGKTGIILGLIYFVSAALGCDANSQSNSFITNSEGRVTSDTDVDLDQTGNNPVKSDLPQRDTVNNDSSGHALVKVLPTELVLERIFPSISFEGMVYMTYSDGEDGKLFVGLQEGQIIQISSHGESVGERTFLDIRDKVSSDTSEEGLLGFAFDPKYVDNGFVYVYYSSSNPRRSIISRFEKNDTDGNQINPDSEQIVMEVQQPFPNHNGGHLEFGPDGYLYMGLGDGGNANDPHNNGQDYSNFLGAILRIDVGQVDSDGNYGVPTDNPFVDGVENARPEIWAYGFRNPWRFSFDRDTGDLWVGDVGQNQFEEINLVERGKNYGWNITEGHDCFPKGSECDRTNIVSPVIQYGHGDGCSVIGGHRYRGKRLPTMFGTYIYGDFCSGKIWGFIYDGDRITEHNLLVDSGLTISSFAEDNDGEIYILAYSGGIYRFSEK